VRVLVTGASGFIGRALLNHSKHRPGLTLVGASRRPVSDFLPGVDHVRIEDVSGRTDWNSVLAGVDAVVHTAARVHVMRDRAENPLADYRRVNVEGTLALARQAVEAGVKRMIFLSSVKVNGESTQPDRPFTADDSPGPRDPYGISKMEAERGLMDLATRSDLEVVIIRPVLAHGPGVGANFLSLMRLIRTGLPLPFGGVRNRRSILALENLLDLVFTTLVHEAAANQIFLASDGEDLSTPALIRGIAQAMGCRARLIPVPGSVLRSGGKLLGRSSIVDRLCGWLQVDIEKTRRVLGWAPPLRVSQGLQRTVAHFLMNRK
jgi:nucleoside-diphosphate-sugar epimerase